MRAAADSTNCRVMLKNATHLVAVLVGVGECGVHGEHRCGSKVAQGLLHGGVKVVHKNSLFAAGGREACEKLCAVGGAALLRARAAAANDQAVDRVLDRRVQLGAAPDACRAGCLCLGHRVLRLCCGKRIMPP